MTKFTRQNPPTGFYTYAYLREDGRPYYIGKGKDQRAWVMHGSRQKRWAAPADERVLILKWNLTEGQAHDHEVYLIAVYGNAYVKGGWLTLNFTDGGEGTSGYQYTDELREVRRDQLKGNNYGANVEWTDELRAKLSDATAGKPKTITPAVKAAHENLQKRNHWQHPEHGRRFASCQEMHLETGFNQASFWKVRNGKQKQTHGWTCLDPVVTYVPKCHDVQAAVNKAAATRNAKGAAELGITLEEYAGMSCSQRYRARKRLRMAAA